MELVSEIA